MTDNTSIDCVRSSFALLSLIKEPADVFKGVNFDKSPPRHERTYALRYVRSALLYHKFTDSVKRMISDYKDFVSEISQIVMNEASHDDAHSRGGFFEQTTLNMVIEMRNSY